jgi:hypothetical protein
MTPFDVFKLVRWQNSNLQREVISTQRRLTAYDRIRDLLANKNILGLRRVVARRQKQHATLPHWLLKMIEKAIKEEYRPRGGYDQLEIDISYLAKVYAGSQFQIAQSHSGYCIQ